MEMGDENMRDENRIDLPHDQVAEDNDGQATNEFNNTDNPPFGSFDEQTAVGTGAAPLRTDENITDEVAPTAGNPVQAEEFKEETAAEVAPTLPRGNTTDNGFEVANNENGTENVETMEEEKAGGTGLGWTALVLSIISLFFLPLLTASVGVITGFFAYRNGARTLGMWAIAIGLFSVVMGLFFTPFAG
jgi:hypothetical protein